MAAMEQVSAGGRRRPRGRPLPAALLAALVAVSASAALALQWALSCDLQTASATVVEPETGVAFPASVGRHPLVATGVRRKYGAVKVYAVGLYLNKGSRLWGKGPTAEQFMKDAPGHATLRLVISSRLVTQAKLASALQESVRPRLRGLKAKEADEVMEAFGEVFMKGPALRKGTVIVMKLGRAGIQVEIGRRYRRDVMGAALTKALLAAYVDSKAVVPEFRSAILAELGGKKK